ncbi:putative membrane protein [Flammeovirgaceae bacterium 311]|nr:putative membrane protein [Flammeovirgaceae bacterium 311]
MKFREIFRYELAYQLGRVWTWLFIAVLLVLSFLMTRDGSLSEVLYAEFFLNSPFSVAKTTVFGSLIWLVMAAAIAGDAAARDVATGMYPLIYTTTLSKREYLGGRFLAALLLNAIILLAVQGGILLGVYLPGVDTELIGPFRPAAFLTAYTYIALPTAFVATALQFLLATLSGRAMAGYFGSFLLVFMGFFVASFLLFHRGLGALLDPIGIRFIVEDVAHLWTTIEKSWRLLELEGKVLVNRLIWLGIGLLALAFTYLRFSFAHRSEGSRRRRWLWSLVPFRASRENAAPAASASSQAQAPMPSSIGVLAGASISVSQAPRTFGLAMQARKTVAIAWTSFRMIATSWAGLALLVFIPLLTIPVVLDQMESGGFPLVPTTAFVISELTAPLSAELSRWVIIPFLLIFFAGELVWRERDAGLSELTDTMPGSDWTSFGGKFLGIALVLIVFLILLAVAGLLAQLMLGYQHFEIGLYGKILFGLQLPEYLLFALLALVVHVLVNHKYIGHLLAIIAYVIIALSPMFGIEHNLLIFGGGPGWSYTEMQGFGPSLGPWLWFKLYWACWALLLAVVAKLLWVRGREKAFGARLRRARQRFTHSTAWTAGLALALILVLGSFIFYNTNILNEYLTTSEKKERQAAYERRYERYADSPQPHLTAAKLQVEIYPGRRAVDMHATYRLVNRSAAAIDSIHLATVHGVVTEGVTFDRKATPVRTDEELYHRIYALEEPLQPGDSLQLNFRVQVEARGFRESGVDASVLVNGTYFTNAWLPTIGYQRSRALIHASDRREYGLSPRPLIASLYDTDARKKRGEGIVFEAVVGTDEEQLAVAPGDLRRTWTEGGRRYFHYVTDGPIGSEWAFFSARYALHEALWTDSTGTGQVVNIRIFHHPQHTAHLDRMLQSIRASLEYYSKEFGPYDYSHLNVVERPGRGTGMHADASMLSYAEGFSLFKHGDDQRTHDHQFAVVAHEMGHQWTVPYANVEGAPVMSESLAWYYAMKAVENARGHDEFRRLLNWMRQSHRPEIRRGEPLLQGLDPYMSYRKGAFALYTLSEYIGTEQVNSALRRLLEKHQPKEAPLATTLDLYAELHAVTPDSLQYLLHDLYKVNTYWELETTQARAEQTTSGSWQVTLEVQAQKEVVDEAGVEQEVPMDDWVEIGIFESVRGATEPLYLQQHRIRTGEQTITVTIPRKPSSAGIDPNYLLTDQQRDNNNTIEVKP